MSETIQFASLRGCMKSGTNWVGEILDAHPEVCCRGEHHWQNLYLKAQSFLSANPYHPSFEALENGAFDRSFSHFVKELMIHGGKPIGQNVRYVIDRSPCAIDPHSLGGPIIYVLRDGRSVVVSRVFHILNRPNHFSTLIEKEPFWKLLNTFQENPNCFEEHPELLLENEYVLRDSTAYWARQVQRDLDWISDRDPETALVIRYEDLRVNFEAEMVRLFGYLGLDPLPEERITQRIRPGVRNPSPTAFRRAGKTNDWERYFERDAVEKVYRELAGEAMVTAGYWTKKSLRGTAKQEPTLDSAPPQASPLSAKQGPPSRSPNKNATESIFYIPDSHSTPDQKKTVIRSNCGNKSDTIPCPPPGLMEYGESPQRHLETGTRDFQTIKDVLADDGVDLRDLKTIYEFGCCNARVLRHFCEQTDADAQLFGSDINGSAIQWCMANFPCQIQFFVNTTAPHLPFEDGSLDLAFAYSIFTHIDDLFFSWLLELHRCVRKGGYLAISIQDEASVDFGFKHRDRIVGRVIGANQGLFSRMRRGDISFLSVNRGTRSQVFVTQQFFEKKVERLFNVVSRVSHTMGGHQSLYCLKRID